MAIYHGCLGQSICRLFQVLGLRTLGNFKKIPEMLGIDGKYPAGFPTGKFRQLCKKTAKKIFHRKPTLFNFVNLSAIFYPRL